MRHAATAKTWENSHRAPFDSKHLALWLPAPHVMSSLVVIATPMAKGAHACRRQSERLGLGACQSDLKLNVKLSCASKCQGLDLSMVQGFKGSRILTLTPGLVSCTLSLSDSDQAWPEALWRWRWVAQHLFHRALVAFSAA